MKLVFIGPLPPPLHGKSLATQTLAAALSQRGAELQIIDTSEGRDVGTGRKMARKLRSHLSAIATLLSPPGPVYISPNSNAGMWLTSAICLVARARRHRLFLHHHSYDYVSARRLRMVVLARACGAAATHIVLNRAMAADLQRLTPEVRQTLVLNNAGAIDRSFLDIPVRSGGDIVLGHLSNLTAEKGVRETVELAIAANDRGVAARLILAGPANDSAAREAIRFAAEKLGDRFEYRGAVDGAAKHRFLSDITHFIFPTRYRNEASPLVLLEAMAAGVSCLASARACIPYDLGADGGIAFGGDFVEGAVAYLEDARSPLNLASAAARKRYLQLLQEHEGQMELLMSAMT